MPSQYVLSLDQGTTSNAIVWQCRRTAGLCEQLKAQGLSGLVQNRRVDRVFAPQMAVEERDRLSVGWKRAIERSREWVK